MDELERAQTLLAQLDATERGHALDILERYAARATQGLGPLIQLLGIEFSAVQAGYARCSINTGAVFFNPVGLVHGGIAYMLIDSAMGAAFFNALERPLRCATIELKINYLRSLEQGMLHAEAELIDQTSRFGVLTSRVTDDAGRLIALAQGTFAILGQPRPPAEA